MATQTQIFPIQYQFSDNSTLYIYTDTAQDSLSYLINFSEGVWAWGIGSQTLSTDSKGYLNGAAQSVALSKSNFTAYGDPSSWNLGTLYFSAINYQGANVLAVYLDTSSAQIGGTTVTLNQNGDGIYALGAIIVQNGVNQLANSTGNFLSNIGQYILTIGAGALAGQWASVVTNGGLLLNKLQSLNNAVQSATGASITFSVKAVATMGWAPYLKSIGVSNNPATPIKGNPPNYDWVYWVIIIGAIAVLIAFLLLSKKKKR